MALFLYNLTISIYSLLIHLASLFNHKARLLIAGRKDTWVKLEKFAGEKHENVFWVHAASLGEFEQGRPIIERLKKNSPFTTILLSFFSPSGYEIRKEYVGADLVIYLPADNLRNARNFLRLAKPKVALFIKYEFWHYYLKECSDKKVLTISVSSIFRKGQPFFEYYGNLHRKMLRYFDHIFVQDEKSKILLNSIDFNNITISGDTRFDRVVDITLARKNFPLITEFKGSEKLLVLGSVWPSDMQVLLPFFKKFKNELKFIIAPHNIGNNDVQQIRDQLDNQAIRYSEINNNSLEGCRFLIMDNMGMLSSLYGYGEFAYVGGAFRKTLHNTLEAAVHGIPVFFGSNPANVKFREAMELQQSGAGISINDSIEFAENFSILFSDEDKRKILGKIASDYVSSNTGATEMIVNYITQKLT
jgi:3-deoxy-D-manno-octulosonic-acid transferase